MSDPLQFKYDEYEQDFQNETPKPTQIMLHYTRDEVKGTNTEEDYDGQFEASGNAKEEVKKGLVVSLKKEDPEKEKMIEQNIKLKTQIYELAKQMDEIMQREKKQKKYGIHADQEQDEAIKAKKGELKRQQLEIMALKNKIFLTKRQLEHVYDSRGIQGKEDELKSLQKELRGLQQQKDALLRVKKEQTKALKMIRSDNQYEEKVRILKEQLGKTREECKHLSEKLLENERVLRKNHELYVTKQAKIKEMEARVKDNREKARRAPANQSAPVTAEMLADIDTHISELQRERKEAEKTWNEKIQGVETELAQKRLQEQRRLLILKEKEKQLKLNEIRIKELKKLIQHHTTEAGREQNEPDPKEFRHRRNIKHLDK